MVKNNATTNGERSSVVNKNKSLIFETCGQLSKQSYKDYFLPLIKNEENAVNNVLKQGIMQDVLINNEGIINLEERINRFSNLSLGANVSIKLSLSPLFAVQPESWKLSVQDFNIKRRMVKVRCDNQFCLLKKREAQIVKKFPRTKLLPFTLEILPCSVVTYFYEKNINQESSVTEIDALFPSKSNRGPRGSRLKIQSFYDNNMASNGRQVQAIEQIVGFSSYPFPYVLFGPPGTGKSSTVAEAIKQVHRTPKLSRILVCAPSNVAVDVLTEKVLNHVNTKNVLRIVAFRQKEKYSGHTGAFRDVLRFGAAKKEVIPWVLSRSNESIIVLCTSVMGYVVSEFLGKIFTHVFYDEAGFSSEPECLLAIKPHLDKAFIVLSGDHFQLGPVVISQDTFGLTISLMERLMTCDSFYKRGQSGGYNPRFITKLVHNYRSDFRLLKLPSELFYEGELIAKASPCLHVTEAREKMGFRFPFIFIDAKGTTSRPNNCTSMYNSLEVEIVQKVVNKLIKFDNIHQRSFGVISPYRAQYMQMESMIHYCPRIEFGSPELFQGREKDVIIISTTRSSKRSRTLGFLNNFKRFNVAITRARYLCIVVGDSELLQGDPMWGSLIDYIKENGGFISWTAEHQNDARGVHDICDTMNRIKLDIK